MEGNDYRWVVLADCSIDVGVVVGEYGIDTNDFTIQDLIDKIYDKFRCNSTNLKQIFHKNDSKNIKDYLKQENNGYYLYKTPYCRLNIACCQFFLYRLPFNEIKKKYFDNGSSFYVVPYEKDGYLYLNAFKKKKHTDYLEFSNEIDWQELTSNLNCEIILQNQESTILKLDGKERDFYDEWKKMFGSNKFKRIYSVEN